VALGEIIRKQAMIMAYSDTFAVLGGLLLLACGIDPGHAEGAGERRWRTLRVPCWHSPASQVRPSAILGRGLTPWLCERPR